VEKVIMPTVSPQTDPKLSDGGIILKGLARQFAGDEKMTEAQSMRIAGTLNTKYDQIMPLADWSSFTHIGFDFSAFWIYGSQRRISRYSQPMSLEQRSARHEGLPEL
jgi:hypothetical protein